MTEQTQAENEQPEGVDDAEPSVDEAQLRPQPDPGTEEKAPEIEAAEAEIARLKDALARTQAEMDNVRKRATRDVEAAHKYALERFVEELLPVKDAVDLGLVAARNATEVASLKEGVEMTAKMFDQMLGKIGVEEVNPDGERFDPEFHQAMTTIESSDHAAGTVVTVMQKGFTLNGRLVRPALVGVASAPKSNGP